MEGSRPQPLVMALGHDPPHVFSSNLQITQHGSLECGAAFLVFWNLTHLVQGKIGWSLEQMRRVPEDQEGCNAFERTVLGDLEITQKYMQRVMAKSQDKRLSTRAFHAQANLLTAGLLSRAPAFLKIVREFHDRTGQA
jgi:hypothetical protein